MNRQTVISFNRAYAAEPTAAEQQFVTELLTVWGKFDPAAQRTPATLRKGILFGLALQKGIAAGEILLPKPKPNRKGTKPQGQTEN